MIKKVFKSEIKRIFANKSVLFVILAVAFLLVTFFSVAVGLQDSGRFHAVNREEYLNRCSERYEYSKKCYEYLAGISDERPDGALHPNADYYYHLMKVDEFYLATGTIDVDYIDLSHGNSMFDLMFSPGAIRDKYAYRMLTLAYISIYIAIIISVFLTVLQSDRYRFSNVSKNYYAANINDRQLFLGKYAVTTAILVAVWIFMCFWGLSFTFGHKLTQQVLYYSGGAYHTASAYTFYFTLMLYDLIAMLAFSALVCFIGSFTKKLWQQFALSLGAILLLLGFCLFLKFGLDESVFANMISFFPLWGLYFNSEYYFFNVEFWIVALINVLLAVAFIIGKIKLFKRADK